MSNRVSTVARPKKVGGNSERIDLRVPSEWLARVREAAKRNSIEVSQYIRMAVINRMDQDEIPIPKKPAK